MSDSRLKIFSGNSNRALAEEICRSINEPLGEATVTSFPDGESFVEMQARITAALARLVDRHRGSVVVAVSHADPIKAALAQALGMHLDLFQRLAVAPGSITTIAYGAVGPTVLGVNSLGDGVAAS